MGGGCATKDNSGGGVGLLINLGNGELMLGDFIMI